ncbi:MAG: tetratricopeptide repeat protein [Roseiflexaceae bacterium]
MFDILANALGQMLGEMLGELFGETLDQQLDKRRLRRGIAAAVKRAAERFAREYRIQDAELADALTQQTRFADLPSVRAALRDLVARPFHDPAAPVAAVQRSFAEVLPERVDRARVDAAVAAFLGYLGQEVLYIPQLQQLYALAFQKTSAESSRQIAASTAALAQGVHQLRDDLRRLPAEPLPAALPAPARLLAERPWPWHNLPQRSYTRFVGRKEELEKLTRLLLPYPRSRHFLVTLDGIGGVGKSALAIELAYRYRDDYAALPEDERFDAIVWASAKRTLLTASGIQQRQQTFSTLADLYREIATVLEQPAILQADEGQRRGLVERTLAAQRTLLIVDNLETVDDEELLSFLRELPDPTKAIVTTRHRIDIAYTIRLAGMPEPDAQALMLVEAARKNVPLFPADDRRPTADDRRPTTDDRPPITDFSDDLYRRTGGVPLAIVWSIGLMSLGHSVESVLRRLGSGQSDIARFCFAESVARIRERDAYKLLLALALFERSVNRQMLGEVAGLGDDIIGRDDGLAELLQLSLVEQKADRFKLLPLTQSYALEELAARPELEQELRERWVVCLTEMARPYATSYWRQPDRRLLWQEGAHFVALATWAQQNGRPDALLRILPALASSHNIAGRWDDMHNIGLVGLEYAQLIGDRQSVVFIETHILAWVLNWRGCHVEAIAYIEEALTLAKEMGDVIWQCEVLHNYAKALRFRKVFDGALERCQQVLELLPQLPDTQQHYFRADIEYELGKIARDRQEWQTAREHFLAAHSIYHYEDAPPVANVERYYSVLANLGYIAHQLGDLDAAAQMYRQALDYYEGAGSKGITVTLLVRVATLEEQRGHHTAALDHAREALDWSERLGMVQERTQAAAIVGRLGGV